jgi:hypothetical protein
MNINNLNPNPNSGNPKPKENLFISNNNNKGQPIQSIQPIQPINNKPINEPTPHSDKQNLVLIAQKVKNDYNNRMRFKVRHRVTKGWSPNSYEKTVNLSDPNDLSYLLEDLKQLFNAPVDKAHVRYQDRQGRRFPF